jgi:hypothetical protein
MSPAIPMTPGPLSSKEVRLRCVEAAARAVSGTQFAVPSTTVLDLAKKMEEWING